ncbi:hypothetical protein [Fodinicola acaciae]|uniref:hypothetical protein n=1 Tax=Fodinicola acaciae TaxID=2681555 RepID=UPI0013D69EA5|nr:hypothetical protein [Fodinicola acaciae]
MKRPYVGWLLAGAGYAYGLFAASTAVQPVLQRLGWPGLVLLCCLSAIVGGAYCHAMTGVHSAWRTAAALVSLAAALWIGALGPFYSPLGFTYVILSGSPRSGCHCRPRSPWSSSMRSGSPSSIC